MRGRASRYVPRAARMCRTLHAIALQMAVPLPKRPQRYGPTSAPSKALLYTLPSARQAVNKYQRLAAVLRGEHPRGMLPPAPRGYVATRLRQLAGTSRMLTRQYSAVDASCADRT